MQNGCICCTLREDLIKEIAALAKQGKFDYLLIESTGVAEPLPVAQAFTFKDEHGNSLNNVSRLDTMVTVVDCVNFHKNLESVEKVIETVTKGDHEE
jgi:G3E family GTPase